jgi:hypothetical protein
MNLATITRDQLGPAGSTTPTLGQWRLDFDAAFLCQTLELPDNGNAHMISCVPAGVFPLVYAWSEKHGREIWHIVVPGRDNIEVHIGDTIIDTDGCVLVGQKRGDVVCKDGVTRFGIYQSHGAFDALYAALAPYQGQQDLTITILNPELAA